jgi:ribonuclease VapC
LDAAHRFRHGRHGLNLGVFVHDAAAKHLGVAILATDDALRRSDLATVA